jgi:glycosyltransferase involved in cell wall biosynthesis
MKVLFIHQNCPGQFKHLAPSLARSPGNEVVFITRPGKPELPGVKKLEYTPARKVSSTTHRYLRSMEEGVLNGQAVANVANTLRESGFRPDVIVAHVGWGEALYVKAIWPGVPLLAYFEWYYRPFGSDVDFDQKPTTDDVCRINTRNAMHLLSLEMADWGITPTRWQWRQHPLVFQPKLSVIHDGIDTDQVKPNPQVTGTLKAGLSFKAGDELITYVARNLEPYRGFEPFMRAAALILKRRPQAHILVVGGDGTSYGKAPEAGQSYRQLMLQELGDDLDLSRIHFLGRVSYAVYLRFLQLSAVHIYLTYPFVLSWSMLEAMACGCAVIGSRTAPVEEVIQDGLNGLLVDFFSPTDIAGRVDEVLDHPDRMAKLRQAARQTVLDHYALTTCLRQQAQLISDLAQGKKVAAPPPARPYLAKPAVHGRPPRRRQA